MWVPHVRATSYTMNTPRQHMEQVRTCLDLNMTLGAKFNKPKIEIAF